MAFQFPWTNLHELNLDWFLSKFKQFTNNYLGTTATAESVPYGTQPTVTVTGGELDDDTDIVDPFTFNFKIPAGQQGEQGEQGVPGTPGQDGFSPIATVTKSGTVATITITDVNGTTTATISDGEVTQAQLDTKAPAIMSTASGLIANFSDGADDLPMSELMVGIVPVQSGSGDPAPDNIRPISGWTGCNVTRTGANLFNASDGIQDKLLGRGTGSLTTNTSYMVSDFIPVEPTKTYYYGQFNIWYHTLYDANKNILSGVLGTTNATSITIPSGNARYIRISCLKTGQATAYFSPTATAFEPYNGSSLSISWQTEAGTVFGGTLDVKTGVLTVDSAIVDLGDLTWTYNSGQSCMVSENIRTVVGNGVNVMCDRYATITDLRSSPLSSRDKVVGINKANSQTSGNFSSGALIVKDTTYTNASTFKTAVAGSQLVYELATPQTYQLTPQQLFNTLYGVNNVWSDTGDSTVTYTADTMLYIQNLTQPTEDDMIANTAIANGKFFMIGNNLYRATTAIASGSQIIPGTNATALSLADALNLL